ncbi:hypothetical protein TrLO_g10223 [Triparma laevis f. longispina]|uniref:Uncharacterized protein n=1 Tax=Triparma laevis f. longispina TaxID=1714387 RepID=A0A9W7F2V8_9STRA|nr:hypothetical protein TrLO_g10223 [Triparma laevis f. longispina]
MFSAKGYLVEEVEEPPDELLNPHLRDLVRRENESGATDMYLRDYKSTELDLSFKDGRRPSISVRFQRSNIVAFTSSFANVVRRSRTNGKYGIWGHYIEELHITEIFSIGGGESEPTFLENS